MPKITTDAVSGLWTDVGTKPSNRHKFSHWYCLLSKSDGSRKYA